MTRPSSDINLIHRLIEGYFNATLSTAEERRLRDILAVTGCRSPEIDSARAVLGYCAASGPIAGGANKSRRTPWLAAASVAIMLTLAITAITHFPDSKTDKCIAYVGGDAITDTRTVLAIMHNDLTALSDASLSIRDDISIQLSELATELSK